MSRTKNNVKLQEEQVVTVKENLDSVKIYLGPNLPGGRLLQSTVFRSGIPAYLQPLIAEQPDVEELIVPVNGMNAVQERIVQSGTAEYAAYQRLLGKGN